jgi:deazaflavin-dependent oxidoreductase (nitroreductase family)
METSLTERLNRIAGRHTLRLTHYGRKSGRPYEVTIWFAVDGDKLYLPTANIGRQWVRNVRKTPRVEIAVGSEQFRGEARFLTKSRERDLVQMLVARKYWMFLPVMAVGRLLMSLGIVRDHTGFFEVTLSGT